MSQRNISVQTNSWSKAAIVMAACCSAVLMRDITDKGYLTSENNFDQIEKFRSLKFISLLLTIVGASGFFITEFNEIWLFQTTSALSLLLIMMSLYLYLQTMHIDVLYSMMIRHRLDEKQSQPDQNKVNENNPLDKNNDSNERNESVGKDAKTNPQCKNVGKQLEAAIGRIIQTIKTLLFICLVSVVVFLGVLVGGLAQGAKTTTATTFQNSSSNSDSSSYFYSSRRSPFANNNNFIVNTPMSFR